MTKLLHIPTGEYVAFISVTSHEVHTVVLEDSVCFVLNSKRSSNIFAHIINRVLSGKSGYLAGQIAYTVIQSGSELELIYD